MEFFNNKRLLIILSGVACILIALVIFVMSVIGFGNIGAFFGGKPHQTQEPSPNSPTQDLPVPTPTAPPTQTPGYNVPTPTPIITTPPVDVPTETPTVTPEGTELPTETPDGTPTPTEIPVMRVSIVQGSSYTMKVGETVQLQASILPSDATNQTLTWDGGTANSIAVVSKDGFVAALSVGEIWVTVRSHNNMFAQIKIIVVAPETPTPTIEPTPTPTVEPTPTPTVAPTTTPEVTQDPVTESTSAPEDSGEPVDSQTDLEGNE